MLHPDTLKFLRALRKNNNKTWFDANRGRYEVARKDFETLIQEVIDRHARKDPDLQGLVARNCLYRINRDIRFSHDKTPYKKNFAASLDKGGKKSGLAGYYFHFEPGNSFIGAGIWQPPSEKMKKIRQEIEYCTDEFEKILHHKKFRAFFPSLFDGEGVKLKKIPRGFDKDHPSAPYVSYRSWMILYDLSDNLLLSDKLLKNVTDAFAQAQPFVHFINRSLEE